MSDVPSPPVHTPAHPQSAARTHVAASFEPEPAQMGLLQIAARTLRRPEELVDAADGRPDVFAHLAPRLLLLTAAGAAIFGMVTGTFRGGPQAAYGALKMPILLLVPPLVVLPAARAFFAMEGVDVDRQRAVLAGLVGMARTAALSTALTPPLWLLYSAEIPHHLALLCMLGALGLVGLPGLLAMARSVAPGALPRQRRAQAGLLLVLGLVFAQTGWMLRPFMGMPDQGFPFLCPVAEDIFTGLPTHLNPASRSDTSWDCPDPIYLPGGGPDRATDAPNRSIDAAPGVL